ncbi:TIGR03557 family F420-dependent LLM class oxidoreductase [Ktedonosporobacter rubrisoli]|uniref:TIGR03557 family F420-dependent LLM class oxidoreductase n=1 Tax=Ktedonosporobacter rubrisoli TaxID=2509675 RepID=A0A4P6JTL4_KTERU|nr:TIGR03557 family F420-dependent LLM class oxidoreductase [Ktedonosporobacter rubrisoli]QBD78918.1 TIGR03557 family F420-dependent LLM class oxidoreductase [Ktedonosporobacter rubrisoli]
MVYLAWKAGPEQYPPKELLEYAIAAEQAGFDAIDVSDHFQPWSEAGQACFTWTWLGAAAASTNRIQLGPGVTCPILRYHPSIIAQAAATVSALAPGRFFLALGTGEALNEYAATGFWPGYEERQERLREAIELIRALWSGEQVTYEGKYYQTRKAKLYTPPSSPIPIYISTLSPQSAAFAGKYGDGLISVGGKQPPIYKQIMQNFEQGAREAGKDPTKMHRMIELNVAYTEDIEAAIKEQLKYWAGTYIPALFDQKIYSPAMSQENGEVIGPDTVKKTGCFSSDPQAHVKFARQHLDLGFDYLFFHAAGPDQLAFLKGYARDVLPRLRQPEVEMKSTLSDATHQVV